MSHVDPDDAIHEGECIGHSVTDYGHTTLRALTSKASAARCECFDHGSIARGGIDNGAERGDLVWL